MALRVEDLTALAGSFVLPKALEAKTPAELRGESRADVRLLVTSGPHGMAKHARFADLPSSLEPGDVVVLNASATIPSSLRATRAGGETFDFNVSTRGEGGWCVVEPRGAAVRRGETVALPAGASATFLSPHRHSRRLWACAVRDTGDLVQYLHRHGVPIAYAHLDRSWPIETYQNVYATEAGSAEMPSAGRPFTRTIIDALAAAGVGTASVILHTGVSSPERDEPPYAEYFKIGVDAAARVQRAHASGGRVIAVGTTVVRALESAVDPEGRLHAMEGWTDLIVSGGGSFRIVNGMITGFHEPRSTHLAMLEALAGREHVERAYAAALEGRYLWHEFGDSHLLLP